MRAPASITALCPCVAVAGFEGVPPQAQAGRRRSFSAGKPEVAPGLDAGSGGFRQSKAAGQQVAIHQLFRILLFRFTVGSPQSLPKARQVAHWAADQSALCVLGAKQATRNSSQAPEHTTPYAPLALEVCEMIVCVGARLACNPFRTWTLQFSQISIPQDVSEDRDNRVVGRKIIELLDNAFQKAFGWGISEYLPERPVPHWGDTVLRFDGGAWRRARAQATLNCAVVTYVATWFFNL